MDLTEQNGTGGKDITNIMNGKDETGGINRINYTG